MPLTKDDVRNALGRITHPLLAVGLLETDAVRKVAYCDGYASLTLAGGGLSQDQRAAVGQQASAAVRLAGKTIGEAIHDVHVEFVDAPAARTGTATPSAAAASPGQAGPAKRLLPNVKHIVAVGAGKGGVGKSTIAVNLAVGLARKGHAVGLLDGDIYGPSIPTMLGLGSLDTAVLQGRLQPFAVHGIKAMTIGKLVEPDKPLIWRGPMAHSAFRQLVDQTDWGELDYLIIDLPPGTGDVALTMAQSLTLTGAVVVCTPQRVAQDDAVRAARMFQQLRIEVLGVVENMSYFVADDVSPPREYDLFGRGGAEYMAQRLGVPFLGEVPITVALRQNSDQGDPVANFGESPLRASLETLVNTLESQIALASFRSGASAPTLTIS
ncbi:MAG: Mrp/NBP35 family ATP-binding protein [Phycisphaeraceae bacterium]|nr:Mrp/NBP35 family ATP-binding protein [Phycisphaeraceae bacterium]